MTTQHEIREQVVDCLDWLNTTPGHLWMSDDVAPIPYNLLSLADWVIFRDFLEWFGIDPNTLYVDRFPMSIGGCFIAVGDDETGYSGFGNTYEAALVDLVQQIDELCTVIK
jgi:hypothetical protein